MSSGANYKTWECGTQKANGETFRTSFCKEAEEARKEKQRNVYCIQLSTSITIEGIPSFGSKETSHVYVVASSFEKALGALHIKYPKAIVRNISLQNYMDVPIVIGE